MMTWEETSLCDVYKNIVKHKPAAWTYTLNARHCFNVRLPTVGQTCINAVFLKILKGVPTSLSFLTM